MKTDQKPLTARQREIYQYLESCLLKEGRPPTVREIGEKFGITSTNGVRAVLNALIKKGYIQKKPKVSRGIDLVAKPKPQRVESNLVEIPVLGRIAAGQPVLAVENLEGTVTVDRDLLLRQSNVFALRVKGESMKDAGIFDGDLIFARQQSRAEKGQIVVATIGDESTVKYYHPEKKRVRLEPANEDFGPIIVDENTPEFRIAGRVIGIMRQYK